MAKRLIRLVLDDNGCEIEKFVFDWLKDAQSNGVVLNSEIKRALLNKIYLGILSQSQTLENPDSPSLCENRTLNAETITQDNLAQQSIATSVQASVQHDFMTAFAVPVKDKHEEQEVDSNEFEHQNKNNTNSEVEYEDVNDLPSDTEKHTHSISKEEGIELFKSKIKKMNF